MPKGESSAYSASVPAESAPQPPARSGTRYEVYGEIASGGMASVQYGRLVGPRGFSRGVAIKRLHPHLAKEPASAAMFIDEARLSARLVHANIIPTLDVIEIPGELALVMEYVHGESLLTLFRLAANPVARGSTASNTPAPPQPIPIRVACAMIASVLHGLHAAHETKDEAGVPLDIVHRDVSPPNILIGVDGIPRVLDFGVAKASGRMRATPHGEIKGKLAYIAPEQLQGAKIDRRADIYSASAVLWEALVGRPLFDAPNESALVHRVLFDPILPPSTHRADVPAVLDALVLRGLDRKIKSRFATAREMALLLERDVGLATQSEVTDWLQGLASHLLEERAQQMIDMQDNRQPRVLPLQVEVPTGTRRIGPLTTTQRKQPVVGAAAQRGAGRRSSRLQWLLALVGLVLLASLGLGLAWAHSPEKSVVAIPLASPPTAARLAAPPTAATAAPGALVPTTSQTLELQPAAAMTSRIPDAEPAHASPLPRQPAAAAKPKLGGAKPAPVGGGGRDKCNPYYTIDDRGIRQLKPECL
jgi:serine/threonine protein kinase